jgi:sigma-E processing peptidase SpoIIGA
VIFIYVFYLDVFLVQNFLMNLIVLSLIDLLLGSASGHRQVGRSALAAFFGAAATAAFFLMFKSRIAFVAGGAFVTVPLMVLLAFGFGGGGFALVLRRIMLGWISCVVLEGAARAVYAISGIRAWKIYALGVSYFLARRFLLMLRSSVSVGKREFSVTLCSGGKSVTCLGLYDSGCLITMPKTGEPVSIVSTSLIRELLGDKSGAGEEGEEYGTEEASSSGACAIPYSALGTDCGTLPVYRPERMEIQMKKGVKVIEKPWIGSAQETLFCGRPYRIILNAGVMENE